jgi:hypothetical protein
MKKAAVMILVIGLISASLNIPKGHAEVRKVNKEEIILFTTSEQMLLSFIEPKVEEIVQKEYGMRKPWRFIKVNEVKHVAKIKEPKSWFEVKTLIAVGEKSQKKYDNLTLKFSDHYYNDDNFMKNLRNVSFELLDYKHNVKLGLAVPWSKYPDNSEIKFADVDTFYESLDKKQYVEFKNAKFNIREKTYNKDINTVMAKADKYGKARTGGDGYSPTRQVYVFITVSEDGKKMRTAVFDAENQKLISASSN